MEESNNNVKMRRRRKQIASFTPPRSARAAALTLPGCEVACQLAGAQEADGAGVAGDAACAGEFGVGGLVLPEPVDFAGG